jgi:hypothetical protein
MYGQRRPVRSTEVIQEGRVLAETEFNTARLKELSREFLAAKKGRYSLLRLTFATDAGELVQSVDSIAGMAEPHDIGRALTVIRGNGIPNQPIARLVATPEGALLSVKYFDLFFEQVLSGRDPAEFVVGGERFRLVHFRFAHDIPKSKYAAVARPPHLHLFFVGAEPTEAAAARMVRLFQGRTGVAGVTVQVRPDVWFLSRYYPDVYRFVPKVVLPDTASYNADALVSCYSLRVSSAPVCRKGMPWLGQP